MTIDKDALKQKYAEERDKRLRPDGNDQYLRLAGPARPLPRRPVHAASASATPLTDHVTVAFIGGGFAGLVTGARLKEAGHRRRPHHREGRRLRRHLVLEPLPGRAVRHRVVRLHAAARRDRPHADGEVRARARDPRALPAHRQAVRPLRQRAVPHRGHRPRVGRRRTRAGSSAPTAATSSPRSSSRWAPARCTCPKLPGIPGIEDFQGHSFHTSRWDYDYTGGDPTGAPMDNLADKRVAHHRHRRHGGAVRPAPRRGVPRAVRVPAHAVVGRRARQPPDRSRVVRHDRHAGLAAALARELHRQPDRRHGRRGPGDGRLDRPLAPHPRQDHVAAARRVHAREDDGGVRGLRLREDGGDPRARRLDRRATRTPRRTSRRGTASCASGRASTTSTCRRTTSPARTSSTPTARASSASPRTAWSSAASSTRSTASSTRRASRSARRTRVAPATTRPAATA